METKLWQRDEVRFRLEEAAETLKAQSLSVRDMPSGRITAWPDVVHDQAVVMFKEIIAAFGGGQ
jgi:hypothetical protein